jgi:hypothetical protein
MNFDNDDHQPTRQQHQNENVPRLFAVGWIDWLGKGLKCFPFHLSMTDRAELLSH